MIKIIKIIKRINIIKILKIIKKMKMKIKIKDNRNIINNKKQKKIIINKIIKIYK